MKIALCVFAALALGPVAAYAQSMSGPSKEMHAAMMKGAKQSQAMKPSGNVDEDFVKMMRQHHQTGIRMAEVQMREGKDEKVKEMARKIVESQKEETKEFDAWLAEHGSGSRGASTGASAGESSKSEKKSD